VNSRGNSATITGAGSGWKLYNSDFYIGQNAGASNNLLVVSNGANMSLFGGINGTFYVGSGDQSNRMIVAGGAYVTNQTHVVIGNNASSSNNSVLVTGSGTRWDSGNELLIGQVAGAINNQLVVSNGAVMTFAGNYNVVGNGGNNSSVIVSGSGSKLIMNNSIDRGFQIGNAGNSHYVILTNGGLVVANDLRIGSSGAAGSGGSLTNAGGMLVVTSLNYAANNRLYIGAAGSPGSFVSMGGTSVVDNIDASVASANSTIMLNYGVLTNKLSTIAYGANGSLEIGRTAGQTMTMYVNGGLNTWYVGDTRVGAATGARGSVILDGVATVLTNKNYFYLGYNSTGNVMQVINGARMTNGNYLFIGTEAGASDNYLLVSNGGSILTPTMLMGAVASASNNLAIVTGAGSIISNSIFGKSWIGHSGGNNTLIVSNGGLYAMHSGGDLFVGDNAASSNKMIVDGAGSVVKASSLVIGWTGSSNKALVSNGASVLLNSHIYVGFSGAGSNLLEVSGGSYLSNGGGAFIGGSEDGPYSGGTGNMALVTGSGTRWDLGSVIKVGGNIRALNNSLVLSSNAIINGSQLVVGDGGVFRANGNSVLINSGAIANFTNNPLFQTVAGWAGESNTITVEGAGSILRSAEIFVGAGAWANYNSLIVSNGATVTASGVNNYVGVSGTNNSIVVNGGTFSASGILNLGTSGGTGNVLRIDNAGSVALNQLSAAILNNSVQHYGGTLVISNGGTTYNPGLYTVGDGSQSATLGLIGGTHTFASNLVINNGATLYGANATFNGSVTNRGLLTPGMDSTTNASSVGRLTFNNSYINTASSTQSFNFLGQAPGFFDSNYVAGTYVAAGVLNLRFDYDMTPNDWFVIVNNNAQWTGASNNWSAINWYGNYIVGGTITNIGGNVVITNMVSSWSVWDGNNGVGNNNWSNSLNWVDDRAPINSGQARILFSDNSSKTTPFVNTNWSVSMLAYSNLAGMSSHTLSGSNITLTGFASNSGIISTGIWQNASVAQTINNDMTVASSTQSWYATGGNLNLGGATYIGSNILNLQGANGYVVNTGGSFGLSNGTLNVAAGSFTVNGAGSNNTGAIRAVSGLNNTVTGAVTLGSASAFGADSGANLTLSNSTVSGAFALTKVGAGSMTVLGTNSNSGTILSNGTLIVTGSGLINHLTSDFVSSRTNTLLTVTNGGDVLNRMGIIGLGSGNNSNNAIVTGAGSLWSNAQSLVVGASGATNRLIVENGGVVAVNASAAGSQGIYIGSNSTMNSVLVSNGGTLYSTAADGALYLGRASGANSNSLVLTGASSTLSNISLMYVGFAGSSNNAQVLGGAILAVSNTIIGEATLANSNSLLVSGTGSRLTNYGTITVGQGTGGLATGNTLVLNTGATVYSSNIVVKANNSISHQDGTLIIGGGGMNYTGSTFTVGSGTQNARLYVDTTAAHTFTGGLLVNTNASIYAAGATIAGNVTNRGNMNLGTSSGADVGTLTINGNMILGATSTNFFNFNSAASFDNVAVNGTFFGGGVLDFTFNYSPLATAGFRLFDNTTWAGSSNDFSGFVFQGANVFGGQILNIANDVWLTNLVFSQAPYIWDGNNGTGNSNWSTGVNWVFDAAPVNDGTASIIIAANSTKTNSIIDTPYSISQMTFSNLAGMSTHAIGGSNLTIMGTNGVGIYQNSSVAQFISNRVTVGASQTWDAAGSTLVLAGTVNVSNKQLTLTGAGGVTFTNGSQVVLSNGGTLNLQSVNARFSDGLNVQSNGLLIGTSSTIFGHLTNAGTVSAGTTTNTGTLTVGSGFNYVSLAGSTNYFNIGATTNVRDVISSAGSSGNLVFGGALYLNTTPTTDTNTYRLINGFDVTKQTGMFGNVTNLGGANLQVIAADGSYWAVTTNQVSGSVNLQVQVTDSPVLDSASTFKGTLGHSEVFIVTNVGSGQGYTAVLTNALYSTVSVLNGRLKTDNVAANVLADGGTIANVNTINNLTSTGTGTNGTGLNDVREGGRFYSAQGAASAAMALSVNQGFVENVTGAVVTNDMRKQVQPGTGIGSGTASANRGSVYFNEFMVNAGANAVDKNHEWLELKLGTNLAHSQTLGSGGGLDLSGYKVRAYDQNGYLAANFSISGAGNLGGTNNEFLVMGMVGAPSDSFTFGADEHNGGVQGGRPFRPSVTYTTQTGSSWTQSGDPYTNLVSGQGGTLIVANADSGYLTDSYFNNWTDAYGFMGNPDSNADYMVLYDNLGAVVDVFTYNNDGANYDLTMIGGTSQFALDFGGGAGWQANFQNFWDPSSGVVNLQYSALNTGLGADLSGNLVATRVGYNNSTSDYITGIANNSLGNTGYAYATPGYETPEPEEWMVIILTLIVLAFYGRKPALAWMKSRTRKTT